ncbi:class I SAM-dependent methyltransferase [Streptomyces sp. RerS4]|uniref:class I SAM-dependent methyltransferase n=1 Tax=Streptomyces sp. RerS4 TaxID=2942449 RepID=UPI00201C0344|nr:class I SAM-dependent methyltransferase [Streptomyces sp. RerS4]UQX03458.1 methyltransferase domain-containing protein [Streptomyces sp. RerS4]
MGTNWKDAPDVASGFEAYDDLPERVVGYPAVFAELRLGTPGVRTVLDYGCGPGKVARRVVEAFDDTDVIGADISARMLDIARARRSHPRIGYRQVESGRLDFLPSGSVDAAMSCYVFINIGDRDAIRAIVAEVHRVLRPGARYAVLDTNPATTGVQFSKFRNGDPGRTYSTGELRRVLLDVPAGGTLELVDHHWPREVYLDALTEAGFTDVRAHEPLLGDGPPDAPAPHPELTAERVHPPFLIVTGVK